MTTEKVRAREARASWRDEMRSAWLYGVLAEAERGTARESLFRSLAREAESQARIWVAAVTEAGGAPPPRYEPDMRARLVAALVRRYGPRYVLGVLAAMKVRGLSVYRAGVAGSPRDEASGPLVLPDRGKPPPSGSGFISSHGPLRLGETERRHRGVGAGGNFRAAVFGVNDGLVSNLSLILGVAGASASNSVILLTGVAGLLAGASSMAAGEWVSVRSQREMFEYQIGLERAELAHYPAEEAQELALIYEARGLPPDEAAALATSTVADPERALDTLAREELGLNPDELGSPWGAATSSFLSFAAGALIPVAPFLVLAGSHALYASIALTAAALFAVGAAISLFTGGSALRDGLRMLAIGAGAGAFTFGIGRVLGVSLG